MFDSPIINIVIGLTLIYLLYSLLASILSEMIATTLNLRALLLRVALERMLNDGYYARRNKWYNGWHYFVNAVRWLVLLPDRNFKTSLAGRFYEHPSIKYLTKVERRSLFAEMRPSYITDIYFVSTLTRMLTEMGIGANEQEKITSALQLNTLHMQKQTAENIRSIFREAGGDVTLFKEGLRKWYNETMDRSNGWYKRKMQGILIILGLLIAIMFNVDSIRITKLLAKDPQARAQLVQMSIAVAHDSIYEKTLANDDTLHRATILDSGYAHLQQDISDAGALLGLGWQFSSLTSPTTYKVIINDNVNLFKRIIDWDRSVDSIEKVDSMLRIREEQDRLSVKMHDQDVKAADRELLDSTLSTLERDVYAGDKLTALEDSIQRLLKIQEARKKMLANDSLELNSIAALQQHNLRTINKLTGKRFSRMPVLKRQGTDTLYLQGDGPFNGNKLRYIISSTFNDYRLLGFLITALMMSLGAPFWFDLLKRLVSLRGAGVKPDPTDASVIEAQVVEGNAPTLVTTAADIPLFATVQDEFVWRYRVNLLALPPVRAVFSFFDKGNCKVQINVTGSAGEVEVRERLVKLGIEPLPSWILIEDSGTPVSIALPKKPPEHAVGNDYNRDTSFGSLSCILKDTRNKDHFVLSCWHVLKGDTNLGATSIEHPFVVDSSGKLLAELETGGILETLDYGLARCRPDASVLNNQWLKNALQIQGEIQPRAVVNADLKDHKTLRYFDIINNNTVSGIIYSECEEVIIDYPDKPRKVQDLLLIMHDVNTARPISQEGNSGALLFDEGNNAVGMIIACDSKYTYAMKLSNFFSLHNEKSFA